MEYQYYEFQAIDRPLNAEELASIRRLSRRVELTPRQAVFTYSYGDFPDDPLGVLEHYFDAMLYLANWGTTQLAFRFPRSVIDPQMIEPYCVGESLAVTATDEYVVLNICIHEEGGGRWIEGEGELAALLPLRDDILRGDLRVLYLAWLKAAQYDESTYLDDEGIPLFEEDEEVDLSNLPEPPLPANLNNLSPPLRRFIDLFEIDTDLVAVAAESSSSQAAPADQFEQWVTLLPEVERDAFLIRLARGEAHLHRQLVQRLRELAGVSPQVALASADERRTLQELLASAEAQARRRAEQERQAAEQARIHNLEMLAQQETAAWEQLIVLIEAKKTRTYDDAVALLIELRDLAVYQQRTADFQARVNDIYRRYPNRPALISRLKQAGLVADT